MDYVKVARFPEWAAEVRDWLGETLVRGKELHDEAFYHPYSAYTVGAIRTAMAALEAAYELAKCEAG